MSEYVTDSPYIVAVEPPKPTYIDIRFGNGEWLKISLEDGSLQTSEGADLSEAAKVFWGHVQGFVRSGA